jgi:hypothetical protein
VSGVADTIMPEYRLACFDSVFLIFSPPRAGLWARSTWVESLQRDGAPVACTELLLNIADAIFLIELECYDTIDLISNGV